VGGGNNHLVFFVGTQVASVMTLDGHFSVVVLEVEFCFIPLLILRKENLVISIDVNPLSVVSFQRNSAVVVLLNVKMALRAQFTVQNKVTFFASQVVVVVRLKRLGSH